MLKNERMEVCLIVLSRLSAANSHDRLIEEPDNRGPDKRGCTILLFPFEKLYGLTYTETCEVEKVVLCTYDVQIIY